MSSFLTKSLRYDCVMIGPCFESDITLLTVSDVVRQYIKSSVTRLSLHHSDISARSSDSDCFTLLFIPLVPVAERNTEQETNYILL